MTIKWLKYIPARIILIPFIRYDRYLRKRHIKPDEWYWADKWLCDRGHFVGEWW